MDETITSTTTEETVETATEPANPTPETAPEPDTAAVNAAQSAEVARLKAALDKATKEAAEQKRKIRSLQSAEDARAEEEKERQEAIENELKELRKKAAVGEKAKRIIAFTGDETVSTAIAEALYGAEDADAVIDELSKAWTAKEKKLRMEYGKIPAPGAGDDAPTITKEQLAEMNYTERVAFATKYPDTYKKLTH
jgi:hypothetical protein